MTNPTTSALDNSDRAYLGLVLTNLQKQKPQAEENQTSQGDIDDSSCSEPPPNTPD